MKQNFVILLLIVFIFSCTKEKKTISIKGSFKESFPDKIYLTELSKQGVLVIDSSEISKEGHFELNSPSVQPAFYVLWVKNSRGINLVAFPGDKIKVYINSNRFDVDYTVEGSPESHRISRLVRQQYKTLEQITELSDEFERIRNNADFISKKKMLDSIYDDVFIKHKAFSEQFILENSGSLANLMALDQQLGRSAPVFDLKNDFRIYELVDSSLTASYPSLEIVKNLNRKVIHTREQIKLEPGAVCPEIALKDTSGNLVSLSSLKGAYVIVSFWASWCRECVEQTEILKKISRNNPSDQLKIYQVSFDRTMESWKKGIAEGNHTWINVSDLKYLDSNLVYTFLLKKIPYYLLLDKEGKIILKGEDMALIEQKINEIL